MDGASSSNGGDSDLSESWTLIDKDSIETDECLPSEENNTENSIPDSSAEVGEETQDACEICDAVDSRDHPDFLPTESNLKWPNEGTESIDSDGISIISESEEEEELQLLPCNPPPPEAEERSGSRLSNKYFDETDTSSQCSSRSHDLLGTEAEKKYVHQPNSALNTSLNILLAIAFAAVLGLGMGHFMGLQEECSSGNTLEEKAVNNTQKEELSALLLKKLELENIALKEQFANLQSVIEEIRRNNSARPCYNKYLYDEKTGNVGSRGDGKSSDSPTMGAKCEIPRENPAKVGAPSGMPLPREEPTVEKPPEREDKQRKASADNPSPSDEAVNGKDEIFPKLEKSLEDIASLFYSTVNGDKTLPEASQEALSGAFSVFSSLMENVQEKVNGLKKSVDEGTVNFDIPFKAIGKMEDVIQKTSQKIQKVAKDALKEGQPLYTISSGITSKLKTINKKLEHKWCQIKKNLSKQSTVLSWLDEQIFHNCSDEEAEDEGIGVGIGSDRNGFSDSMDYARLKNSELGSKKRKFEEKDVNFEKYIYGNEKKSRSSSSDENNNNKEVNGRHEYKRENSKDKYKNVEFKDPNAFGFDYVPKKGKNKENWVPKGEGKRRKMEAKKGEGYQYKGKNQYQVGSREEIAPSGEWVEAMFNSRAERRRDERRSDWVFARARSRTKSREMHPSRWYLRRGEEKL
ncbi:uncharacterized protein LOC124167355 [Ischnura elegans]|uniref:uncharacterized protein LOC124167355 n=1 Tax=Ischnura elegans TaxID=197161 RepID=UPI001ED87013|nr:uncharacterized protein LOC124167355 [Ischnura elegans]XP_046401314.1 uncharacterized protein LOC124167355 [Ischnura elegans]XP_046401316.1 uncharacterized protein LOC124167355 [Ischnura elegans]XP_046401317.1 uncharacterized protein LOC124167355 [Ischnura elegans]XP_046401318.1 uncharacterized protein LOC124167355 [Ischnura elegans]